MTTALRDIMVASADTVTSLLPKPSVAENVIHSALHPILHSVLLLIANKYCSPSLAKTIEAPLSGAPSLVAIVSVATFSVLGLEHDDIEKRATISSRIL